MQMNKILCKLANRCSKQEQMLAGKYKNAQELESAYLELQKKLGWTTKNSGETEEQEDEQEQVLMRL